MSYAVCVCVCVNATLCVHIIVHKCVPVRWFYFVCRSVLGVVVGGVQSGESVGYWAEREK